MQYQYLYKKTKTGCLDGLCPWPDKKVLGTLASPLDYSPLDISPYRVMSEYAQKIHYPSHYTTGYIGTIGFEPMVAGL